MLETLGGGNSHVDIFLESTLDSVDQAEALGMDAARELGFDDDGQHEVGIAVRESMVNAVAHGNRYNARKRVHLQIQKGPHALTVEIVDEGPGFNPDIVPDPTTGENVFRHSGRGLLMIRAYMDEFEIKRLEPNGTYVRMVKRLPATVNSDS
jgi:serine/threonine-protein kinase RsbW